MNALIDSFQAKFPPNRLVALAMAFLLPTVIVPAAGFLAVWVPAHFPGLPTFTAAQLTAFGIAGVTAALLAGITAGYQYIDGWQSHEAHQHQLTVLAAEHRHGIEAAVAAAAEPHLAGEMLEQLRPSLKG